MTSSFSGGAHGRVSMTVSSAPCASIPAHGSSGVSIPMCASGNVPPVSVSDSEPYMRSG